MSGCSITQLSLWQQPAAWLNDMYIGMEMPLLFEVQLAMDFMAEAKQVWEVGRPYELLQQGIAAPVWC